jgi:hypothetical protein
MRLKKRFDDLARDHFWLCLAGVILLQTIALLALLSDSGAPLLLYQGF